MKVRHKIGMVFQEGALFDSLSVYDNVAYRLREQKAPESEIEPVVMRMLRFVDLEDAVDKMPNELSGGMRRRVGIGGRWSEARRLSCMTNRPPGLIRSPRARSANWL